MPITVFTQIVEESCYRCGVTFGLPHDLRQQRLRDHRSFWCPNGHEQHYVGEAEESKLRRRAELAEARATHYADQAAAAERSKAAVRGHLTRLKNRIAAGACPCCHREFPDLHEHMAAEHPGYGEDA